MRDERESERFSQQELAEQLGVTRSALSNFEQGRAPLSFTVGYAFCRRLDISPRWLATGEEPKRPFPLESELGIGAAEIQRNCRRGVDFLSGYERVLRRATEAWTKENPVEKIVMRMMRGGVEPTVRRWSNAELVEQLRERIKGLRGSDSVERKVHADIADAMVGEVGARLSIRRREGK